MRGRRQGNPFQLQRFGVRPSRTGYRPCTVRPSRQLSEMGRRQTGRQRRAAGQRRSPVPESLWNSRNERGQACGGASVKRYYLAAAAEDGATACSLLTSALANSVAGGVDRSASSAVGGCGPSMSLLLRQQHRSLTAREPATMVVIGVYLKGDLGLALLGFRRIPESTILVEREARVWKIDALFDSELT